MAVERSRASYLIDVLGMLKVEGSNPGHPETFIFVSECRDKNELIRDLFRELIQLDFRKKEREFDLLGELRQRTNSK